MRPQLRPTRSQAPLIGRRLLFGNPDKESPRISPDGKQIAFLAPRDGVMNVWVAPIAEPDKATPVTNDKVRGIRNYDWTYTNQHLLYLQDKGGDENWRIYRVNLGDTTTTDLTPIEKVQARLQHLSNKRPREVLIGLNDRDPRYHDIYRLDLESGKRTLAREKRGVCRIRHRRRLRSALRPQADQGRRQRAACSARARAGSRSS